MSTNRLTNQFKPIESNQGEHVRLLLWRTHFSGPLWITSCHLIGGGSIHTSSFSLIGSVAAEWCLVIFPLINLKTFSEICPPKPRPQAGKPEGLPPHTCAQMQRKSFKVPSLLQVTDWIEVEDHLNSFYLKDTKDKHRIIAMHSSASYRENKKT